MRLRTRLGHRSQSRTAHGCHAPSSLTPPLLLLSPLYCRYAALFYIAFFKTTSISFFGSFGYIDVSTNEPYADMCAAAGGPDEPWTRLEGSEGCATSEEHCRYLSVKDDCMGALMTQVKGRHHPHHHLQHPRHPLPSATPSCR